MDLCLLVVLSVTTSTAITTLLSKNSLPGSNHYHPPSKVCYTDICHLSCLFLRTSQSHVKDPCPRTHAKNTWATIYLSTKEVQFLDVPWMLSDHKTIKPCKNHMSLAEHHETIDAQVASDLSRHRSQGKPRHVYFAKFPSGQDPRYFYFAGFPAGQTPIRLLR